MGALETHALNTSALFRSLVFERFGWRCLILGVSLAAAVAGVTAPYAQKKFVDDLIGNGASVPWVVAAFLLTLLGQILSQLSLWLATRESMISQKALADRAYSRVLEGPGGLVGRAPAGEAVSLFAVDIPGAAAVLDQALVMASSMIFPLLLAPLALWHFFSIPIWSSGAAIVLLATVNVFLARRQSRFFYRYKQMAAERTGLVSEWVQNIRTLRILGWVKAAEKRIFALRRRETRNRKHMVTNGQVMNSIATSSTFGLNILAVLMLLHLRGEAMRPTPGEILSLLWILGVFLARPLRQLPWSLVIGMDSLSSVSRLEKAFLLPVRQPSVEKTAAAFRGDSHYSLEVRGLNLESEGTPLLKEIDLKLKPGRLVAVVGEVGSGKSLLLQSLVGATPAQFRLFAVNGKPTAGPKDPEVRKQIGFVPQEGFTMSATLRENVLFTYLKGKNDPEADRQALFSLAAAQFRPEAERVVDGLNAEIGERGVNLSGGQRQRVGLARAHFAGRPIVLLDDCLSAVDVDTEKHLIEDLICGAWKQETRLLVTHRLAILPYCDQVIFLENGAIAMQGTHRDLLRASAKYRDFVRREEVKGPDGKEVVVEAAETAGESVSDD